MTSPSFGAAGSSAIVDREKSGFTRASVLDAIRAGSYPDAVQPATAYKGRTSREHPPPDLAPHRLARRVRGGLRTPDDEAGIETGVQTGRVSIGLSIRGDESRAAAAGRVRAVAARSDRAARTASHAIADSS